MTVLAETKIDCLQSPSYVVLDYRTREVSKRGFETEIDSLVIAGISSGYENLLYSKAAQELLPEIIRDVGMVFLCDSEVKNIGTITARFISDNDEIFVEKNTAGGYKPGDLIKLKDIKKVYTAGYDLVIKH